MIGALRPMCRILGCAPSAIYRHFPGGAREIDMVLAEQAFATLMDRLEEAANDPDAPGLASLPRTSIAARLARSARAYIAFARAHPKVYRRLFGPKPSCPDSETSGALPLHDLTDGGALAHHRLTDDHIAGLNMEAARNRELAYPVLGEGEARRLAVLQWTALHGFTDLDISGHIDDIDGRMELRVIVSVLGIAGFTAAANPAALESAAYHAENPPPALQTDLDRAGAS